MCLPAASTASCEERTLKYEASALFREIPRIFGRNVGPLQAQTILTRHRTSHQLPEPFTQSPSPNTLKSGGWRGPSHTSGRARIQTLQVKGLPPLPHFKCLTSSQEEDLFRSLAASSITCAYSSGLPQSGVSLDHCAPRHPGIHSQENGREHCQMASSQHARPVAPRNVTVPFVRLPPHSLAGHVPHLPTHIPRLNVWITVHPTPQKMPPKLQPSGTRKAVQPSRLNFWNKGHRSLTPNLQKYLFASII